MDTPAGRRRGGGGVSASPRTIDVERMAELYRKHGSVHRVGEILGMHGQTVHYHLKKHGIPVKTINVFTDEERERLRNEYAMYRDAGQVKRLADDMGRTVQFLSRQARALGLTKRSYPKPWLAKWKYMSDDAVALLWETFKDSRLGLGQFCAKHEMDDEGFRKTMLRHFPDEWEHVIELKAPKQSMYRLGRAVEYAVRDDLRKHGYFVLRSPASKTPIDLVAIKTGEVVFLQCKRSGAVSVKEWNEFWDLCISVDADPIIASRPTGRGIKYQRILAPKDGSRRRQPWDDWRPSNATATGQTAGEDAA